jgi:ubiquinone/menaquinone biosynthesis C-methylase UbiE
MLPALAAEVGSVTGIDISAEMVERAKRRCQSLSNVTIRRCSGLNLTEFADARFDLVLAADVLPYVFEAGPQLVDDIVREMTRVLVPNGTMVLLNFSYRADHADADRCDISHLAHSIQLDVVQNGSQPFKLWDATAFVLKKRDPVRVDRATH